MKIILCRITDYLVYKTEGIMPDGLDGIDSDVQYWFEQIYPSGTKPGIHMTGIEAATVAPYSDDNPHRLFRKIASMYQKGDGIRTISAAEIRPNGVDLQLREPLSHYELRILTIQVLEAVGNK